MKIIIFAGGVGTRLWPLSRKNSPKQFEKIIGDKSTLQRTVARISHHFDPGDIYIATGKRYGNTVMEQLPNIPKENFIMEPEMRDVGPAIGLATAILAKKFGDTPIAILWSDHMVKHEETFRKALLQGEELIAKKDAQFVFITQKPRFANQNIGWIRIGEKVKDIENGSVYRFIALHYRPELEDAEAFFQSGKYVWNLGYFVTTPNYLLSLYKSCVPGMYEKLMMLQEAYGTRAFSTFLDTTYSKFEKISFDDAILKKLSPDTILVISEDIGWSDIGAWEALKEALAETEEENITQGNVMLEDSEDCLVYNYAGQLIVGIDLKQTIVINTDDVLLICPKTSVPKIKKLVEKLANTPHKNLV